ncbi:hypothetical protein B0H10DRAFT_2246340 [Mycena sp. CBHHK59/15]|nr:hypothetical protein B0H10DRAFT_2246340 [Mycena sp. CBHHK59/15]
MSVQVREIKTKRGKVRRKRSRAPETVQVREDNVQVRRKPKFGQPSDRFCHRWMMRPILILSHHHLVPPPARVLASFTAVMDEWQYSQPFWDGSSEAQRRQPPHVSSDPAAGVLPSFALPTDSGFSSITAKPSINLTDFGHPSQLLPFDLIPGVSQSTFHSDFSVPALWDAAPFSSPAPFSQQPSGSIDDPSVQPHWDDFVSSLQPAPARTPSTGSGAGDFFNDGYGIDLLMADIGDEYSSSRFPSAPPSSTPEDDGRSSRPPTVFVEIEPWDDADWTSDDRSSEMFPVPEPDLDLVDEAPDMDARLGWEWKPSGVKWLDPEVSSEVVEFPNGTQLTDKQKIYALHRVKGCPSQFPFYRKRTAFFDSHSWGGSSGGRNHVDAHLPGSFFGLADDIKVACRRANPKCGGVSACESLDPAFLNEERRELDPEPGRRLAAAMLRTCEMQDDTEVGRTLAFHHSLQSWRCNGIRTDWARCDGSISLRKLNTPDRKKNHILLCFKRSDALTMGSVHSSARILDHVSEELFVKVMNGQPIVEEDDTKVFNHHKNGLPYVAKVQPVTCIAKMHIYCPWETLHPELARMAVVVPSESGHTHPPPLNNKCTRAMAERYRECVRKIGLGATVAKVENAQSTKDLIDGKTPSIFHPGLISRDTKTRLVQQVKAELNKVSATATTTRQQVATYLADQEALSDEKRYLHSSLSRDGKRIIFAVTVMRVWMELHDRRAYKTVWEEVQRIVLKLTRKQLKFKGLHKGGEILGLNSDMEAAPLLGFADAFVGTVDLEEVRSAVISDPQELLSFVLRICYSVNGVPDLPNEIRRRIFDLKYAKTLEEVEAFKAWILTVVDPEGVLKRWWDHKLMHRWLLWGIIQCLSNIPLEQWNTMEATTNLGEAQHAWNNAQTGISMGVIESFKKYEELDVRRAEEIELRKLTAIPRNARNETRNSDKARRAQAADSNVAALEVELSGMREDLTAARSDAKAGPSAETTQRVRELEAAVVDLEGKLKRAKAEAKSSSSGRVRAPRASVRGAASKATSQSASGSGPVPATTATLLTLASIAADAMDSDVAHRVPARKRAHADSSSTPPVSNKYLKKLEDPLAGWVMQDPDTGEKLTGHEWVKRYPEEFAEHYKKDHRRYIEYLAQAEVDL